MALGKSWRKLDRSQKLLVSNPDTRFTEYLYRVLYNRAYHLDIDCLLLSMRDGRLLCLVELIKGLGNEITNFKHQTYKNLARRLKVSYYILQWDFDRGLLRFSNGFTGKSKILSFKQFEQIVPRWIEFLEQKVRSK